MIESEHQFVPEQEESIRNYLGRVGSALDVGCGIRPCIRWLPIQEYTGLEAFLPYIEEVNRKQPDLSIVQFVAPPLPFADSQFEVVIMDDVIEHLDKKQGKELLAEALRCCSRGVLVRTPNGFHRQETDPWERGGDHWQKHRSGWTPGDFPTADRIWHVTRHSKGAWMGVFLNKEN